MTQSLWFLRFEGRIVGPYPPGRIREWLRDGSITPQWEISLDERDWLSIQDSGQFCEDHTQGIPLGNANSITWQREREKARHRWLDEDSRIETAEPQVAEHAEQARRSLEQDHLRTDALVRAEVSRKPAYWLGVLGVLALAGIGYAVWVGQQSEIASGIVLKASTNCLAPAADGVNWQGCDKRSSVLNGVHARRARLEKVRLDDAQLAGADLADAVMSGASLRNVDLSGANLSGADLNGADLRGANFSNAQLSYAVLRNAKLEGVRWEGARLDHATWEDGRTCSEDSAGACR
ncbi:MAG: pentapeptide repeat-containing protein [Betaproteobacteria bacterium]|nr:pentapeptide repeat-containing protein [Betaproteobacteria bacterium]